MILLAFGVGLSSTLSIGLLIILPLWWRNRKMPCFAPPTALVSKAMQARMQPSQWRYEQYAVRRK